VAGAEHRGERCNGRTCERSCNDLRHVITRSRSCKGGEGARGRGVGGEEGFLDFCRSEREREICDFHARLSSSHRCIIITFSSWGSSRAPLQSYGKESYVTARLHESLMEYIISKALKGWRTLTLGS
jgi:hypothetical protein